MKAKISSIQTKETSEQVGKWSKSTESSVNSLANTIFPHSRRMHIFELPSAKRANTEKAPWKRLIKPSLPDFIKIRYAFFFLFISFFDNVNKDYDSLKQTLLHSSTITLI